MADNMRISQILPTVTCSRCNDSIILDDVGTHVCSMERIAMPAIFESPQRTIEQIQSKREPRFGGPKKLPMLFDSSNYALSMDYAPDNSSGRIDRQRLPESQSKPKFTHADTVLGRLDTIKAGPLDSQGMRRQPQMGRKGPVQNRDPRATIMPLKLGSDPRYANHPGGLASPTITHRLRHQHSEDDVASIRSGKSNLSGRSLHSSQSQQSTTSNGKGILQMTMAAIDNELYTTLDNSTGPYHHVARAVNPAIFAPTEGATRSRKGKHNDAYGDEWEERGVEAESMISLLPDAPSSKDRMQQLRKPNSQGSLDSRGSSRSQQSIRSQQSTSSQSSAPQVVHKQAKAMRFDEWQRQRKQVRNPEQSQASSQHHNHRNDKQRRETSSSQGTVLTNSTFQSSTRSSVSSSSPISTHDFNTRARVDSITPVPQYKGLEDTPKATIQVAQRMAIPVVEKNMVRSETNGSFDRLLADIGDSIEALQSPEIPAQPSPSSDYSPVRSKPQEALGSPASLQSKSVKSNSSNDSVRKEFPCQGCKKPIVGRSISSKDGKLLGKWHKQCFICTTCASPFPNGEFYVFKNKPFCARHYHAQNNSLCMHCGEIIEGECIASNDSNERFHITCYNSRASSRAYHKF